MDDFKVQVRPTREFLDLLDHIFLKPNSYAVGAVKGLDDTKRIYNSSTGGTKRDPRGTKLGDVILWQEGGIKGVPYRSVVNHIMNDKAIQQKITKKINFGVNKSLRYGDAKHADKAIYDSMDFMRRKMKRRFGENNWDPLSPKTRPKAKTRRPMIHSSQFRRSIAVIRVKAGFKSKLNVVRMKLTRAGLARKILRS